jgi:hypothetical protein
MTIQNVSLHKYADTRPSVGTNINLLQQRLMIDNVG